MDDPKKTDLEFTRDSMETAFNMVPFAGHFILVVCTAFLLIALFWASISTLNEETRAIGRVVPSGSIQVIQSLDGGIVKEISVQEGDSVEKGQVLMVVDDTQAASSVNEAKTKINALKAKISRLMAESQGTPLVFPDSLVKTSPQLVSSETDLYNARKRELQAQIYILKEDHISKQQQLTEAQGKFDELQKNYELSLKELNLNKPLLAQGVVSEVDILKLEKAANDSKSALDSVKLSIPRLQSDISGANKRMQESELKFKGQAVDELNQSMTQLKQLSEGSTALEAKLHNTLIRSPVKGTVNRLLIHTIGGVIKPGADLIEVVPLEDKLLISANVRPADVAMLRPGLPVLVKITAYDFSIYGGLKGTLERISADTIKNEKGESFYEIRAVTDQSYLEHNGKKLPIKPGMAAEVNIITGQKTVLSYLLKPIIKARKEALTER
jgi:adhesin transport system membrane fusion protein